MRAPSELSFRAVLAVALIAAGTACGDDPAREPPAARPTARATAPESIPPADTSPSQSPSPSPELDARASAGSCRVAGTVVRDGRPAEATVSLFDAEAPPQRDGTLWIERAVAARPVAPVASAQTSAGAFALDGLAPRTYELRAIADDGAAARVAVALPFEGAMHETTLILESRGPTATLRGRAIAPDGTPFRGLVAARVSGAGSAADARETGADGTFELTFGDAAVAWLVLTLPGRLEVEDGPIALPHEGERVVDLSAADGRVRVRVFDETTAAPIAGAVVGLSSRAPETSSVERTDAQGACVLFAGSESRSLYVRADGYPRAQDIELAPGQDALDVPLAAGPSLRARVVRADDGTPVAGAPVHVREYRQDGVWGDRAAVRTGPDGVAIVSGLLPGGALVFVLGEGWFSEGLEVGRVVGEEYVANGYRPTRPADWLPRSGTLDVVLRVVPGRVVEGRVEGHDGRPVAGATVTVQPAGRLAHLGELEFPTRTVGTAPDGRFRAEGLFASAAHVVTATAPGQPGFASASVEAGGAGEVVLRFEEPHRIEVTVVDAASGAPVAGAEVACAKPQEPAGWGDLTVAVASTGTDGRAELFPVAAGEYDLAASHPERLVAPAQHVKVAADDAVAVVFRLTLGATIRGRAVLPDGTAPRSGSAGVAPEEDDFRRSAFKIMALGTPLAPDGTFEIPGVPPGSHPVRVVAQRGTESFEGRARATAGAPAQEVRLVPVPDPNQPGWPDRPTILLRVLGPAGRPVGRASVAASWADDATSHQSTTFEVVCGEVRLPRAVRGTTVTISGATTLNGIPLDAGTLAAPIPAGASDGHEVRLPPGVALRGTISHEDGTPLPSARVSVHPLRDRDDPFAEARLPAAAEGMTAADGTFEMRGLGPVEYELLVEVPDDCEPLRDVRVHGGRTDVRVTLRRGLQPVIVVLGPGDRPLAGAHVTVEAGAFGFGAQEISATTGADGRAVLPVLPRESEYRLRVGAAEPELSSHFSAWTPVPEEVVRLERLRSVAGTVVDAAGEPIADVDVWCREPDGESPFFGWAHAVSDASGAFRFDRLGGDEVEIVAGNYASSVHFSHGPLSLDDDELAASVASRARVGTEDLRLALASAHLLRVRLVGLAARVDAPEHLPFLRRTARGSTLRSVRTRDPATFLFSGLAPDRTYELWGRMPRHGLLAHATGLRAGPDVEVALEPGIDLAGRFVPPDGASVTGLTVRWSAGALEARVTAAADGTFTIPCLPRVEGTLEAWSYEAGASFHGSAPATPGTPVEAKLVREQ